MDPRRVMQNFLEQYFFYVWLACLAWAVLAFSALYFWHKAHGRFIDEPPLGQVLYRESMASGRSLRSWHTRLGGANNCLKLIITPAHLLVTPFFPFSILGPMLDLIHRVPLSDIEAVEARKRLWATVVRIRFRRPDGAQGEIELASRKHREFERVLSEAMIESQRCRHR